MTEPSGLEDLISEVEAKEGYGPLLMTEAAADAIGVSRITLMRWRQRERLVPFYVLIRGGQQFPLYGPDEIAEGKALRGTIPPGPQPQSPKKRRTNTPPVDHPKNKPRDPANIEEAKRLIGKRTSRKAARGNRKTR